MYLAGTALVGLARRGGCFFVSYILAALGWMATFPSCTYIVDGYISYQLHNVLFFLSKRGVFFPPAPSPCHRAKIRSPARGIFTLPWILKRLPIHQVLVLPTSEVYSIHPYLPSPRPLALAGWSVPHDHPSLLYLFLLLQESERTVWMASPELKCKVIIHSFSCYRAVLMIRDDRCTSTPYR